MDIDSLTLGQLKEIAAMFTAQVSSSAGFYQRYIGKKVIVRSRNEGINFGEVVACDATGIVLKNARRLWYHKPADMSQSWYEGVANTGVSSDSRLSAPVAEKAIIEQYGITACTDVAIKSLEGAKANEQR